MLKRIIISIIILAFPFIGSGQETKKAVESKEFRIPVQAQYSNKFKLSKYYFNKRIDPIGRGEVLETELVIKNMTDDPMDIYVFVVATYEKFEKTTSSFEMPIPEKEKIRSFVPYPDDIENYKYPSNKDSSKMVLKRYPKNTKAGINPETSKPYRLEDKLIIRAKLLRKYGRNYKFFNRVTILIFDAEGNPAYRQLYELRGIRR